MTILDGKQTALKISEKIQKDIQEYLNLDKRVPQLDILLVGNDFGSQKYVQMKSKKAQELGIQCNVHTFEESVQESELIQLVEDLNKDTNVDGVMVQLPLPKQINESNILEKISPLKDVDGLTSVNLGKLFKNDPSAIAPATAKGILELLRRVQNRNRWEKSSCNWKGYCWITSSSTTTK